MKIEMRKILSFLAISAAVIVALSGCKDDDEEEDSVYLDGAVSFTLDQYVKVGQEVTVTPSGVTHPDGGNVGWVWSCSWTSESDTTKFAADNTKDGSVTLKFPDEIGTYSVTCYAYTDTEDIYGLSSSQNVVVIDESLNVSISDTGIRPTNPGFRDSRDGKYYYTVQIGDLIWTRQNMAYAGFGIPYFRCDAMQNVFGMYYNWEEANKACPEGWRLPTENDWISLGKEITGNESLESFDPWKGAAGSMMADATFQNIRMWEYWPQVKITNSTGFSAISVGYAISEGTSIYFKGSSSYATFWSAGDVDEECAIYRYIYVDQPDVFVNYADKASFRTSVRCVRDAD